MPRTSRQFLYASLITGLLPCWVAAQQGTAYGSWWPSSGSGQAEPLRLRGSRNDKHVLSETRFQSARPGQQRTFQLRVLSEEDILADGWLTFSESRNHILAGTWQWERARPGRALSSRSMASQCRRGSSLQRACGLDAVHSLSCRISSP